MNSLNKYIYDKNIERHIRLSRHINGLCKKLKSELRTSDIKLADKILVNLLRLSNQDEERVETGQVWVTERLKGLKSSLKDFEVGSYNTVDGFINRELDKLTKDEYDFQSRIIIEAFETNNLKAPTLKSISLSQAAKFRQDEMIDGRTQVEAVSHWSRSRKQKVLTRVRLRLRAGQNPNLIHRSLAGRENRFSGLMKDTHFGAIVDLKTSHTAATSAGCIALMELNPDLDLDFIYSAMIDSKSSGGCLKHDNKLVFKNLKGKRSPMHRACRSRLIPIIGGDAPPNKMSVNTWFNNQSDAFKQEFLGKKRFEILQNSKKRLNLLRDFISKSGDIYTLSELNDKGVT